MHQHMDMIRHHAPRQQFGALVVEEQQRILAQLRDAWVAQVTLADAMVEVFLQLCAPLTVSSGSQNQPGRGR